MMGLTPGSNNRSQPGNDCVGETRDNRVIPAVIPADSI